MSIPIIDQLRPLGNFPAVDASDVQAGNQRLSTVLSNTPSTTYVDNVVSNKVDKVEGKGLSTNDFTNTYKSKLDGLDNALAAKANTSDVTSGLAGKVDKETGKGLSTNDYTTTEKNKLAGIEAQANKTTVDSALSASSENPVQNKVINTALGNKADASTVSSLSSQVSTNTTNIATQTARIDAIATLPSGSTSGDAELMDIRTKADGTTATNAGTAVRDQVKELTEHNNFQDGVINNRASLIGGFRRGTYNIDHFDYGNTTRAISHFIACEPKSIVSVPASFLSTYRFGVMYFDEDYVRINIDNGWLNRTEVIVGNSNVKYILVNAKKNNDSVFTDADLETVSSSIKITPCVISDKISQFASSGYSEPQHIIMNANYEDRPDRAATELMKLPKGSVVTVGAEFLIDCSYGILCFDENGNRILSIDYGWLKDSEFIIPDEVPFIRINMKYDSGSNITNGTMIIANANITVKVKLNGYDACNDHIEGIETNSEVLTSKFIRGSFESDGTIIGFDQRGVTPLPIPVEMNSVISVDTSFLSNHRFGVLVLDKNRQSIAFDYGWLNRNELIINNPNAAFVLINFKRTDEAYVTDYELILAEQLIKINKTTIYETTANKIDNLISSLDVEYGRLNNEASYYFIRIPKYTVRGQKVTPKVAITSNDGSIDGTKVSTLDYAYREQVAVAVNASLFNVNTRQPEGQLVINGVDKTVYKTGPSGQYAWMDDDMGAPISDTECYPLLINTDGDLVCLSQDRTAAENQPSAIINSGYKYAVTAWGMIVDDYANNSAALDEIVHAGKYIRQVIGQFQNGDYLVMSVDKTGYSGATAPTKNEAGVNYNDLANFLIGKGVRIAYSLDGGGSCETVIGNRQVNPIFDGTRGRTVPTVIYFSVDD